MEYYLIDIATEEGDMATLKRIYREFGIKPSLYAKQISQINGHNEIVMYIDEHIGTRNTISVKKVHGKNYANILKNNLFI